MSSSRLIVSAFTYITKEDEKKVNAKEGDHEGIVDIGRNIEGIEVSIFVRESDSGYKISLRSNKYVDVSEIAEALGGGGHSRASGILLDMDIEEIKKVVLKETYKMEY